MKNISLLSKYRSELMGFAMLVVVWFHLPMQLNNYVYSFLKDNGCFGVDIFLLLSGLGLAFSSKKGLNLKEYYVKRFIRIMPIYALVIIVKSLIVGGVIQLTY